MAERPTIQDVARVAGVSNITVSRVANGERWVSKKTRLKVEAAMRELDYRPNAAARSMRSGRTHSVGFVMADLTNSFNALVAETAQANLMDAGFSMFVGSSRFNPARESQLVKTFEERRVDGLLLSLADDQDPAVHAWLAQLQTPLVALDRDVASDLDAVLFDHEISVRAAVEHLASFGHRRIAFIGASTRYRVGRTRYQAFVATMRAHGLSPDPKLIRSVDQAPTDNAFQETLSLLTVTDRPTAILAAGNQILLGVLKAARTIGISIPHDLSLIGGDDPEVTELLTPPITILDRDIRVFAKTATAFLLNRINGEVSEPGRRAILPTRLTIRNSCAPLKR